ncbi:MAG: T9SS type A sorting domain-containing protein, partial [Ignavibacteriales bacterium]|nr:T9SS type A sorting domain-containing protein [Ignavibacteriales bacterium]
SAGSNGSISPTPTAIVNYGGSQTFTITPSTGYHVDSLIVDGVKVTSATSYQFTNVTADHTIRVTFAVTLIDGYRSFCADSLALTKDNKGKAGLLVKRKPVRAQFSFELSSQSEDITGLYIEFSSGIEIAYPLITNPPSQGAAVDTRSKKWDFIFNPPLTAGQIVTISGYSREGKFQKVVKYFWKKYGLREGDIVKYPTAMVNNLKLPMPNRVNVLAEAFLQGGFSSTDGMIIGQNRKMGQDSSKYYAWYQAVKYGDVVKTLYASRVAKMHTGIPKGFDQFNNNQIMKSKQKMLSPTKYDNVLLADMIALKLSIVSSAMRKTPLGFGELIYENPDDSTNPYNGKMVKELAAIGDSLMMGYYENGTHLFADASVYNLFDGTIKSINLAFEGKIDTSSFADSLILTATNLLADVPFLRKDSSIVPAIIIPINNLTEEIPESFELCQNYPNPFNPVTTIEFHLPVQSNVTLNLFNIVGQQVATVIDNEILDEGTHQLDYYPDNLSSGVYFYRITAIGVQEDDGSKQDAKYTSVKKMILMK